MQWFNRPEFFNLQSLLPKFTQKYRITCDCAGFSPNSIKTEVHGNQVVVHGKEETKKDKDDYSTKEFRKTYNLPQNCESDKLVSFMTPGDRLVIEVPLKETKLAPNVDLFPQVVDNPQGGKEVQMRFNIPQNIDPAHVSVSLKDRDVILRAEEKKETPDNVSRFYYYQRTTLPENTDFNNLKCITENNQVKLVAPLNPQALRSSQRMIPIEQKQSSQTSQQQQQQSSQMSQHRK